MARLRKKMKKFFKKSFKKLLTRKNIKSLLIFMVFALLAGSIVFLATVAYISKDLPDPNKIMDRQIEQSTKIYDSSGEELLYEIHGDKARTVILLEEIPEHAKWALISLEDKNFYSHNGLSYKRIIKAVIDSVGSKLWGGERSGGSTLTQQFVKNAILTPERTVWRKFKEFVLTRQLEKKFTKDEILQLYFNEIPYGGTAYGIESAAQLYFGKSARDLELHESATLASIIQLPTFYFNNQDLLQERRDTTLWLMNQLGHISEEEMNAAMDVDLELEKNIADIKAAHFVLYVKEKLTQSFGEKLVEQGGLRVITTLDYELQKEAEEIVKRKAFENEEYNNAENAALIAIEPSTGYVKTMVGSRDYFDENIDGNVNVTLSLRQPGSSFKPIAYAAALEKGYTDKTIVYDVVTTFKTDIKDYTPHNYDLKERGPVTFREALAGSLNIPAVKALYLTGVDRVLDFAERLGYSSLTDRSRFGLSLVLGGGEVTLLEHMGAYATMANDGVYNQPVTILRVENSQGKVLFEHEQETKQVVDANVARMITDMMADNNARAYAFGLNSPLQLGSRPVAAKTGTTNDYRDAWTVGFTPQLAVGVWGGNNDNSKMRDGAGGVTVAAPIWNEFMRFAHRDLPVKSFGAPNFPAQSDKSVLNGVKFNPVEIDVDTVSGKLATEFTPESTREKRKYQEVHSILYYLRKDDPNGKAPEDPVKSDFQFSSWESAVLAWAEKQNAQCGEVKVVDGDDPVVDSDDGDNAPDSVTCALFNQEIPTEYDDIHIPGNQPEIQIQSPFNNQEITTSHLSVSVGTQAPRGAARVEYYLDDIFIGTTYDYPFNYSYDLAAIDNGYYTLKAIVFDDVENQHFAEVLVNINLGVRPVAMTWVGPKHNSNYFSSQFPLTLSFYLAAPQRVTFIEMIAEHENGTKNIIGQTGDIGESIMLQWNGAAVGSGRYTLYPVFTKSDGTQVEGQRIQVEISQ